MLATFKPNSTRINDKKNLEEEFISDSHDEYYNDYRVTLPNKLYETDGIKEILNRGVPNLRNNNDRNIPENFNRPPKTFYNSRFSHNLDYHHRRIPTEENPIPSNVPTNNIPSSPSYKLVGNRYTG